MGLEEGAEQVSVEDARKWCTLLGLKVRGEKPELTWRLETFLQDRAGTLRDPLAPSGVPELLFSPLQRCCCWDHLTPDDRVLGTPVGPRNVAGHTNWRDWYFIAKQPAPHMLRIVPHTVPRVGRSYEHFPDEFELHLLQQTG